MTDERVVVAGAGPVAMTAALLLARWGVPTLLLEAKHERDAIGSKAICFQRDVLDVLDRVGCAETAVAEGVTWWRGLTFYREHVLFETTFPEARGSAFPPFINLSQTRLERLLAARVAAEPLIELRFDHRVVGVEQDHAGIEALVETPDGATSISGRYLVGCDGASSTVRKQLGLSFDGHSFVGAIPHRRHPGRASVPGGAPVLLRPGVESRTTGARPPAARLAVADRLAGAGGIRPGRGAAHRLARPSHPADRR